MLPRLSIWIGLISATLLTALAQTPNVFVLPPSGQAQAIPVFSGDSFSQLSANVIANDAFQVITTPTAKNYFITRNAASTIVITDSLFNVQASSPKSLGAAAVAAALTPSGRYIIVATSNNVSVLDTTSDSIVTTLAINGVVDLAIARDGSRAYVLTSSQLSAFDLNVFSFTGSIPLSGGTAGVTVGPNGLIYVSATNILYELAPDGSLYKGQAIGLNALPGKPYIIGDSLGNLRAIMVNTNPGFGGSSLITVDLGTRVITTLPISGVTFDRIAPVSVNRVLASTVNGGPLYDITLPSSAQLASFNNLPSSSLTSVRGLITSNEATNARYAYIALAGSLARVDLSSNSLSGQLSLSATAGSLAYAAASASGLVATTAIPYNAGQSILPGTASSLPLVVRALDANGRPLRGVPVNWTAGSVGISFIGNTSSQTDVDGYATIGLVAPVTSGAFQVVANVGSGVIVQVPFNLNAGTGVTGPTGAITATGGNGQVIRELSTTGDYLKVTVRDSAGNPVPNALVNWAVNTSASAPPGTLAVSQSVTDAAGNALNTFSAPALGPTFLTGFAQYTITASTATGSVNLYVTVIPNFFQNNPVPGPVVQVIAPTNTDTIVGQAGTTVTGAIQVRILIGAAAVPNVGLRVNTGLDPTVAPTANCANDAALTDNNGLATCDLVLGGKTGTAPLNVIVGGSTVSFVNLNVRITPGLPAVFQVVQGDNQTGLPGQTLPQALVATVSDAFGNFLPGATVAWTVDSGSATLVNTINRADANSRVSTLVRLGSTPGAVKVRVYAPNGAATASATFNLTVNFTASVLQAVSGSGQSAIVGQAFGSPLVVKLLDPNGAPVPGIQVAWSVTSGSAVLSSSQSTADSTGTASINVTAGTVAGAITVTASVNTLTATFTLTALPIGPILNPANIVNAASGQPNVTAGSIVVISGQNIAPTLSGYLVPSSTVGPLPTTLGNVRVTFGGVNAPIFWVANVGGRESVAVQVPFEAPSSGTIPVTLFSGNTSATVNVNLTPFAPGLFETVTSTGRYAVAVRPDGSWVTPDNPAARGEVIRLYVTGLGAVSPLAGTNTPGVGQSVANPVLVGLNDAGVDIISAQYAQNLIGMYLVTFRVPADTATGPTRNIVVAVTDPSTGQLIFTNGSNIAIR